MRVFLSHASEDADAAEQIYLMLINARHAVFFDRAAVQGGDDFNTRIQKYIGKCELLIFLISPNSVAKSSYALTELKFARQKWPHPQGHVLPVIVRPTSYDSIPQYLKAVSILDPEGNAAAEVCEKVAGWKKRHRRSVMRPSVYIPSALLIASLTASSVWYFREPLTGQDARGAGPLSSSPATNNAGSAPALPATPSTSGNIRKVQTPAPVRATAGVKSNQVGAPTPTPFTFVLSSRVFDGERPVKGARVSIAGSPEQGTVETDANGSFSFEGVHKKLNEKIKIRVEHDGKAEEFPVTIGSHPPMLYLRRAK